MKNRLFLPALVGLAVLILQPAMVLAQETKTGKVTVTVTENDKVITDTTFELGEGQDPETVKKIISKILGDDAEYISESKGHKTMVWVSSDDEEHAWHAEEFHIDFDSIKGEGENVMIFKSDSNNMHKVIVKKHKGDGEDVIVMSSKTIHVSTEDGKNYSTIIITDSGDEGSEVKEKKVKVFVEDNDDIHIINEDDLEWIEEDDENVNVYVIKKDDGTQVIKKVKVEVKEVDEEEAPVPVKEKKKK